MINIFRLAVGYYYAQNYQQNNAASDFAHFCSRTELMRSQNVCYGATLSMSDDNQIDTQL